MNDPWLSDPPKTDEQTLDLLCYGKTKPDAAAYTWLYKYYRKNFCIATAAQKAASASDSMLIHASMMANLEQKGATDETKG